MALGYKAGRAGLLVPIGAITAGSWAAGAGGTITITKNGHGLTNGQKVMISGVTPSGYNLATVGGTAVSNVAANTFDVTGISNPGAYVSGGFIQLVAAVNDVVTAYVTSMITLSQLVGAGILKVYSTDGSDLTKLARLGTRDDPIDRTFQTTMMYRGR